jgi:hypothetical protein
MVDTPAEMGEGGIGDTFVYVGNALCTSLLGSSGPTGASLACSSENTALRMLCLSNRPIPVFEHSAWLEFTLIRLAPYAFLWNLVGLRELQIHSPTFGSSNEHREHWAGFLLRNKDMAHVDDMYGSEQAFLEWAFGRSPQSQVTPAFDNYKGY